MNQEALKHLWHETLASPNEAKLEEVANAAVELYSSDPRFREHIKNRSKRVTESTGVEFDPNNFDIGSARAFVADEIGFKSWNDLITPANAPGKFPILFRYAVAAMDRGDFTALEEAIGPEKFHDQIVEWFENGLFTNEQEALDEIFAASCMLGQTATAANLLDKGVDPHAGMKTGLSGFHYAASSGRLEVIRLLIDRKIPMEVKNMYGGTVFGQAMWSAVNEWTPNHAEIVEELVKAGAVVDEGYDDWWEEQNVPDAETKRQIAEVLRQHEEFHERLKSARRDVDEAEANGNSRSRADALKALGNILRRPPFLRDAANEVYGRAANLYKDIDLPLEEAWVKRHIGINHEYAGRLEEAEKYYDEALALYREHSKEDDLNYANAVRYPAVIKERLGKKDEAARLWEEACDRYSRVHPDGLGAGVAEAAAWLTILALESADLELAEKWFARASEASSRSQDPATHKFVEEVRARLGEK
jgi:hypothetical protein